MVVSINRGNPAIDLKITMMGIPRKKKGILNFGAPSMWLCGSFRLLGLEENIAKPR